MSQVVEPQARQPCLLEDSLESSGDVGAVEWLAGLAREDKILFVPFLTEAKPLLQLPSSMTSERLNGDGGQGNCPAALGCLRGKVLVDTVDALEGPQHRYGTRVEVDGVPGQAERLAWFCQNSGLYPDFGQERENKQLRFESETKCREDRIRRLLGPEF